MKRFPALSARRIGLYDVERWGFRLTQPEARRHSPWYAAKNRSLLRWSWVDYLPRDCLNHGQCFLSLTSLSPAALPIWSTIPSHVTNFPGVCSIYMHIGQPSQKPLPALLGKVKADIWLSSSSLRRHQWSGLLWCLARKLSLVVQNSHSHADLPSVKFQYRVLTV